MSIRINPNNIENVTQARAYKKVKETMEAVQQIMDDVLQVDNSSFDLNSERGKVVLDRTDLSKLVGREPAAHSMLEIEKCISATLSTDDNGRVKKFAADQLGDSVDRNIGPRFKRTKGLFNTGIGAETERYEWLGWGVAFSVNKQTGIITYDEL